MRELIGALSPEMFGTEFWSSTLSTLLGVGVGAALTWIVTRHFQKQDFEDRYSERFDGRNLVWMDALDRYADVILEDFEQGQTAEDYTPGDRVTDAFGEFRLRIRQAGLVARNQDHAVLDEIENDVRDSAADSLGRGQFDFELVTRIRMLMNEFTRYRRGALHPSWFAYWSKGTQMPFVSEGHDSKASAPRTNPTARPGWSSRR